MVIDRSIIKECDNTCLIKMWKKQLKKQEYGEEFISKELSNVSNAYNLVAKESGQTSLTFTEYGLLKNMEFFIRLCNCNRNSRGVIRKIKRVLEPIKTLE
ncbi:hypothetical protein ACRZ5S_05345 [Vibrio scophthalmi]|uniref:hypothetical protein n=1 Tax=Vibrio scophthalmi TaxID=45658 RepID=UPI003EBB5D6C